MKPAVYNGGNIPYYFMSKPSSIISLGVLFILLPFISIFRSWNDTITFILGALIIWTGNRMRKQDEKAEAPVAGRMSGIETHGEAQ